MPKLFEENHLSAAGNLIPYKDFRVFADCDFDPAKLNLPEAVEAAEKLLGKEVPALPATLYMQFYRNGNRSNFEGPYFARRHAALTLLMAELTEKKGRFTDLLADYVWAICEESTWVIPAHIRPCHGNPVNCLPDSFDLSDDDTRMIDLFSAMTGATMAWIWYLGGEVLDPVTPVIRRRILDLLKKRIFHPYYDVQGENNWWMGEEGQGLNNWTPWIVSNVLTAVMLCESDDGRRERAAVRSVVFLDRFTRTYPEDGGCDEGPGYWNVAGASYFDCVELLHDLTGGRVSLYGDPFLKKMCEYIADFNLGGNVYANFADAAHLLGQDWAMIARMGRKCGSAKLTNFAAQNSNPERIGRWSSSWTSYRGLRDVFEPKPEKQELPGADNVYYPGLGVMIAKNSANGMVLAAKGGHNAESHNHNDVGSFILFRNGRPVFLDPGVETYCKDTFSGKRYTLWAMRSLYHNLPEVNGCEQKNGGQYRAEILSCENGCMTMELKAAYPAEAGLKSYLRTVELTDGGVSVKDAFAFENEGTVVFSLMTRDRPEQDGNSFRLSEAGVTAAFDPALSFTSEEVPLTDPKLHREWDADCLYRVRLAAESFTEKTFELTVKA